MCKLSTAADSRIDSGTDRAPRFNVASLFLDPVDVDLAPVAVAISIAPGAQPTRKPFAPHRSPPQGRGTMAQDHTATLWGIPGLLARL